MNGYAQELITRINDLSCRLMENEPLSLEEYITGNYIPFLEIKNKKDVNLKRIKGVLKIILSYPLVKKDFKLIDENDLVMFFNRLKKDKGVSKTTINRYRSRLNAIFNHAIKSKIIFFNPVKQIPKAREYHRNKVLSQEELSIFWIIADRATILNYILWL